jgi:hypothetical protein
VSTDPAAPPGLPEPGHDPADEPETWFEWAADWARAVALGLRDTGRDIADAARRGAREARDEYWDRFDDLTRRRRKP